VVQRHGKKKREKSPSRNASRIKVEINSGAQLLEIGEKKTQTFNGRSSASRGNNPTEGRRERVRALKSLKVLDRKVEEKRSGAPLTGGKTRGNCPSVQGR